MAGETRPYLDTLYGFGLLALVAVVSGLIDLKQLVHAAVLVSCLRRLPEACNVSCSFQKYGGAPFYET